MFRKPGIQAALEGKLKGNRRPSPLDIGLADSNMINSLFGPI
jgi:hypothetical protein